MGKIPVGKTIAYAYSFAFGNILSILGVAWFPFLLVCVAGYFLLLPYISALQTFTTTQDLSTLGGSLLLLPVFVFVAVVATAMIMVEVMRMALGMDPGRKFFYFSLDKPVWRLIGAYVLVILLIVGLAVVGGIVLGILAFIVGAGDADAALSVTGIGGVILALALVLVAVRLIFLLPAVVVAENTMSIKRGYHLTFGNFWRIMVVWLAIVIPISIVQSMIQAAVLGPEFALGIMASEGTDAAAKLQQLQSEVGIGLLIMIPVWIILSIANLGLTAGAGAFAYRSRTGSQGAAQS
ncbi:MAG: hypothetical protein ACT4OG_08030 [Alphaproteobacteria bacterium]